MVATLTIEVNEFQHVELTGRSPTSNDPAHRATAHRLLMTEIDFIDNDSFRDEATGLALLADRLDRSPSLPGAAAPTDLPAHLARLCEAALLSAEEERSLFQRMNFLKYRANSLRVTIDPDCPDVDTLEMIQSDLSSAESLRDSIVKANMRLVISVVKRFVTPLHSFDDLLSEGIITMMNAVEKFDYDRGFRFSTYAFRSIARSVYRTINDRQKEDNRCAGGDAVLELPEPPQTSMHEQAWNSLRQAFTQMLHSLDRRERFIIRARYALGSHRKVHTFQSLADKLGVSKERVRQLERRAVDKLRSMATELQLQEYIDPVTA